MIGLREVEKRLHRLEDRCTASRKADTDPQAREGLLARLAGIRERMDRADPRWRERVDTPENREALRAYVFARFGIRMEDHT